MDSDERYFTVLISPSNFPGKLWNLVNDPHLFSICWDTSGEGILIYQDTFEAEVLSSPNKEISGYFKTTDFNSFIRQLNLYGFRKLRLDLGVFEKQLASASIAGQIHHFHNPNFRRANPQLLVNIKRLTPVNKAKLSAGLEVSSQSSRHSCYALMRKEHQRTPYHHDFNGSQQLKECDRTPRTSQAFVMSHGNPGSVFTHFPMDSQYAHPSSPLYMPYSQSALPAGTFGTFIPQYRCYTPVFQHYGPGSYSQQLPASYAHYGYYPDYLVSYLYYTGQNPSCQAGDTPDPRRIDVNPETVFRVADEMQVRLDRKGQERLHGLPSSTPPEYLV